MSPEASGPVLDTERLRLRPCAETDVDYLHRLLTMPEVRRFLLDDELVERDWVAGVVASSRASFAREGWGLWIAEHRDGSGAVALVGLRVTPGASEPQLLYAFDPAWWGRGLATEAAAEVVRHAFETLGWSEILASTDPPNHASMRVMERLGMRFLEASRTGGLPLVTYRLRRADRRPPGGAAGAVERR